jgi:hypothetical protein
VPTTFPWCAAASPWWAPCRPTSSPATGAVRAGIYSAEGSRLAGGTFGSFSQTVCPPPPTTLAPPATDPCLAGFSADAHNLQLFHPADRFWLFQSIETALFVALAVLLLLAAIHLVRRRVS